VIERAFHAMGTELHVYVGEATDRELPHPTIAAISAEAQLIDFDRRLSRFREESELSRFNRDPREEVPASSLLRRAVSAGVWAAERTDGLVDPTLVPELEAAGYATSRDGLGSAPLAEGLAAAPSRRPARPDPQARWRTIEVLEEAALIRRPPGLMFDTGGVGKGLAADLAARPLDRYARYAVDVGGDVRVGGRDPGGEAVEIEVRHPQTGEAVDLFRIGRGAVATSGVDVRLWRRSDGLYAHHLLDPATGEPAWTGIVCASARAPTALEADMLAKAALLAGPDGARALLSDHGGLIVTDDGQIERIAPASAHGAPVGDH
jgi:FAD:protein FMN transferase